MQTKKIVQLVKLAQKQDADALTGLIQLHMEDLYRIAYGILANDEDVADAIQDTILACWTKLPSLREPGYFKTWMSRILINKCYDQLNQRKLVDRLEDDWEPAVEDEYNLEYKEALAMLDEKYRLIMILYYSQGYKSAEIANLLHIPKSTVLTRLERGRKKLAEYYDMDRRNQDE